MKTGRAYGLFFSDVPKEDIEAMLPELTMQTIGWDVRVYQGIGEFTKVPDYQKIFDASDNAQSYHNNSRLGDNGHFYVVRASQTSNSRTMHPISDSIAAKELAGLLTYISDNMEGFEADIVFKKRPWYGFKKRYVSKPFEPTQPQILRLHPSQSDDSHGD